MNTYVMQAMKNISNFFCCLNRSKQNHWAGDFVCNMPSRNVFPNTTMILHNDPIVIFIQSKSPSAKLVDGLF